MATPANRRPRTVRALAFSAATVLLALAALECGSRLVKRIEYPPEPLITEDNTAWQGNRRYDPLLFWSLRPGRHNKWGEINSLGLRGPDVPAKERGELRVLALGESTTYGWRLPYADCYPSLLEQRLRAVLPAPVRVVNAGVPGYTIFQGQVYLDHRGLALEPDAVLLYFGLNDFLNVAFRAERDSLADAASMGLTDRELFAARQRPAARLLDWMYAHSNLVRALGSQLRTGGAQEASAVRADPASVRVPEQDRWDALTAIHAACALRGIDLVIVIPWYRDFDRHAPLLRRFAAEHALSVVDLPALLDAAPQARAAYFQDAAHPNGEGHRLIADAIVSVVGQRWSARAAAAR